MMQKKGVFRGTIKVLIVLALFSILLNQIGILVASSSSPRGIEFTPSPRSADVFREEINIYSKQLIKDPDFSSGPGASPWSTSYSGDVSDLYAKIESGQTNSTIVGDTQTVSIILNLSKSSEWTAMHNPDCPAYPEWPYSSGIDQYWTNTTGFYTKHQWREGERQNPSINWGRNISLPFDVSDYNITSASVTSVVNASVVAPSGTWPGSPPSPTLCGLDVRPSESCNGTVDFPQFVVGDYAKFYVRVTDLSRINKWDIAYNKTSPDLGLDSGPITTQGDTNMTAVDDDMLKAMLTSVLSQDHRNFTVILGVDFWCEDNWLTDYDQWDLLCIKSFNLTFTLQKTVNYESAVNWAETGYKINSNDYLKGGNSVDIAILNATLNFRYRVTTSWPTASPNSEIRAYINNLTHTETIKLSNVTTSFQEVQKGKGFNVASLVAVNENVSIRLQVIMLDTFDNPLNCSILIDDVSLTVYFQATVKINTTTGGLPLWAIYLLLAVIAVMGGLFLEYMLVWKYPPHIRAIRSLIRGLKRGKIHRMKTPTIFRSADASMTDGFLQATDPNLSLAAQTRLKFKYKIKKNVEKSKREVKGALTQTPPVKPIPQPTPLTPSKLPPAPSPTPLSTPPPTQQRAPVSTPLPQNVPPRPQVRLPAETTPKPRQSGGLPPVKELPDYKAKLKPAPKPGEKDKAGNGEKK